MEKVAVIIPVYQETLNENEQKSLQQCQAILGHYPIHFVAPKSLSASYFKEIPNHSITTFDDSYFESVSKYNELLVSTDFYKCFDSFEYLLIYQLDAYVFKDELKEWCEKGYDYIGAPGLTEAHFSNPGFKNSLTNPLLINGGLSLRKVKSFINLLRIYHFFYSKWPANEDTLFSFYHKRSWPLRFLFKLPTWKTALSFAFEKDPEKCFELTQQQLPFGCHAWEKYNPSFWDRFIR